MSHKFNTKSVVKKYDFKFKKKYGQNFIADENIINSIIKKSNIDKDTLVIEIGPGCGSLTYNLCLNAKNVLCYEIDETLKEVLEDNLKQFDNVDIKFKDFLKCNIKEDIKKYNYKKLYVVANLPYYITTPILMHLIDENISIDKIVIMVQKEVGNRFKAQVGSKEYNSLSIYLNYYFDIKKLIDVSRNVFIPIPNVDSIVLEFIKKEKTIYLKDKNTFFKLVKDSFKQKRKTLKNNLKGYPTEKIEFILKKYNLDLSARAEQVSIDIFAEISNSLRGDNIG